MEFVFIGRTYWNCSNLSKPLHKSTVEKFLKTAANDPKVKAIKIVLYRTDNDGSLIDILIEAAENGKQVAVVIELKARFDEESNIKWANRLEDYGVHVTYGLKELKKEFLAKKSLLSKRKRIE